ncbi:MAG TPA: sigma-70 family RNA polymerase sigma factor [Minicystis sp.]|nr:sigma-70 family RNA polymerase sigma factor [Minicystis sp.]
MSDAGVGSSELTRQAWVVGDVGAGAAESGERKASNGAEALAGPFSAADQKRLAGIVNEHFDFIWRSLRRLGVPVAEVDDCAQQVFWVASRKLSAITVGSERAFLFSTALRVASDARRSRGRRREVPEDDAMQPTDPGPRPDEVADQKRARALLDEVLAAMPLELRAVFVLFELEEMSSPEIAALLEIPTGTVASRLRRAREEFQKIVARVRARGVRPGALGEGGVR